MQIIINNFKGILERRVELNHYNVLIGGIGTGKSSVLEAFRFALTGKFGTNPIHKNGPEAKVTVYLNKDVCFARKLEKTDTGYLSTAFVNGRKCTQAALNDFIKNNGIDPDMFEVTSNPYVFSQKTKEEITSVFLNIIPTDLNFDKFAELAGIDDADALFELEEAVEALSIDREHIKVEDVEQLYKYFYERRTNINRQLKTYKEKCKFEPEKPTFSSEEVEKQRVEIATAEAKLETGRKLIKAYEEKSARRTSMLSMIKEKEDKLKKMGEIQPANPEEAEILKSRKEKLEAEINNINVNISTAKSNILSFQKVLANLEGNRCPLSDKLICSTDKTSLKSELNENIQNNQEMLKRLMAELEAKKKILQTVEGHIQKWKESKLLYESYTSLKKDIEKLRAQLPDISDKPKAVEEKDLSKEKELLSRKTEVLVKYNEYLKNKEKADELQYDANIYTSIIKATSPKGNLSGDIIRYAAAPFVEYMNSVSERINSEYAVKLEVNSGLEIMCKNSKSEEYVQFCSLSGGEKILYTFVLFDTINQLRHNRVLMLDDLDRLDSESFTKLLKVIDEKTDGYDSIVLAMVDHPDLKEIVMQNYTQI